MRSGEIGNRAHRFPVFGAGLRRREFSGGDPPAEARHSKAELRPAPRQLSRLRAVCRAVGHERVELLHDNVLACRERLFRIFDEEYTSVCKKNASDEVRAVVRYVLEKNILQGDALALVQVDGDGQPTDKPIIFAEWTFPMNDARVKRRDYRLDVLLKENPDESTHDTQFSLFEDDAMNTGFWETDPVTRQPIPKPIREYPLIHFRRITENDERL